MRIGNYKIKYPAILKKEYEDGSVDYETDFDDEEDIMKSHYALEVSIGNVIGTATDNPRRLTAVSRIDGKEAIIKELENKERM